jgi:hypothetical protein
MESSARGEPEYLEENVLQCNCVRARTEDVAARSRHLTAVLT